MKQFTALYQAIDETTRTLAKVEAMRAYFASCPPADGAWAVFFLCGRRLNRLIPTKILRSCCTEVAAIPDWIFEECYGTVGDLAETMALLVPDGKPASDSSLADWVENRIRPLVKLNEMARRDAVIAAWHDLSRPERFVFNKLVTGSMRVGVSQGLVIRALAEVAKVDAASIAHRLMGLWEPTPSFFQSLLNSTPNDTSLSQPYPFCLAHPLPGAPEELGKIDDWILEWKWDGIRSQLLRRGGETFLWSRGEEPILERFPELVAPAEDLPNGTVLDGEVVGWRDGVVLPFTALQRRIGRKKVSKGMLLEIPVRFLAFDLLEYDGIDLRKRPLVKRRRTLEELLTRRDDFEPLALSPRVHAETWEACRRLQDESREHGVEGIMLKRADSEYGVGRPTGLWWKWKVTPFSCDAVLIYAQKGHGRRADLYTDYTFAVWEGKTLVPFAKAYSGLTDAEIREVDRFIRKNTVERFGPVRSVTPQLVFELAFENIQLSSRHKSGIAVRFPRILRWRHDKTVDQADSLETIKSLLRSRNAPASPTLFDATLGEDEIISENQQTR